MNTHESPRGAAVQVSGLTKVYHARGTTVTAVNDLTVSVAPGEFFSLLGVNGAGKTTTIRMLSCLTDPTAGSATVGGYDIRTQSDAVRRMINVSQQNTAVALNLTVRENLTLTAGLWGASRREAGEAADRIMAEMKLDKLANRYAKTLSGGWQRRLSIAMALITQPEVLFLDEPTLGLDVLARRELWSVISALKGKVTVILTTHYLNEAEALSDRVGIMANGELKALGTVRELCALAGTDNLEEAFVTIAASTADGEGD